MGHLEIEAKDLQVGDEVRVTVMGGTEYLTVQSVEVDEAVHVVMEWGWHIPVAEPVRDDLRLDKPLTVRRERK